MELQPLVTPEGAELYYNDLAAAIDHYHRYSGRARTYLDRATPCDYCTGEDEDAVECECPEHGDPERDRAHAAVAAQIATAAATMAGTYAALLTGLQPKER